MSKKKEITIEEKLKEALISKEEQPYEIPKSWKWIKLSSVINIKNGIAIKSTEYQKSGVPLIRISNLQNGEVILEDAIKIQMKDSYKNYILEKGDLLVAMSGATTGKIGIYLSDNKAIQNQRIGNLRIKNNLILEKYRNFYFIMIAEKILKMAYGGAQPNIGTEDLNNLSIPLSPLEEQQRIVKKLDSMFGRINKAKELIAQAKETLENRKASILNLAFSGELTRKWRKSNSIESSKILLENLNKEKIRLWEEECEKALEEGKKKPLKPKLLSVEEIAIPKEEQPYEIPDNWEWVKLESVIKLISGRDVSSNLCNSDEKGIPYILGASNIKENRFLAERWIETPVVISKKNDILLSVKGTIGKIYLQKESEINISRQIMALRAYSVLEKYYLMYFLENNVEKFKEEGNGLIPGISREIILNKLIQLPPLEEQKEIVRILNETLKREKKIKEILEIENMLELLEKSILDKAFKGELGTQKDTDSDIYDTLKSYNLTKGE